MITIAGIEMTLAAWVGIAAIVVAVLSHFVSTVCARRIASPVLAYPVSVVLGAAFFLIVNMQTSNVLYEIALQDTHNGEGN